MKTATRQRKINPLILMKAAATRISQYMPEKSQFKRKRRTNHNYFSLNLY